MKLALSNITASVNGGRKHVSLVPGTQVDLEELVADGVTLEQALGKDRVAGFELVKVDKAESPTRASGRRTDRGDSAAKE